MGYTSTFFRQSGSLISRNFLLKRRVKRQIIIEFVFPFCFVLVLGFIRLGMRSTDVKPVIPSFPSYPLQPLALKGLNRTTVFVSPNTKAVTNLMDTVLRNMGATGLVSYKQFSSAAESENAYRTDSTGVSLGIDFVDGTLSNPSYTIRSTFALSLNGATFAINQGGCRDNKTMFVYTGTTANPNCPASYYLTKGIALMQVSIDTALIQMKSGNQATIVQNVLAQMMPKDSFQPPMVALQSIASLWFVFTFFPFILFLMMLLVGEKEKKIKEGMRMMGMKEGAYWFSWAVVYTVIILAVCIILTILVAAMRILQNSNLGIFLLIIFLYGLTLITISFMLTPFFDKAQIAGAVASMATIVFGFLYLAISLTRYSLEPDGYLSTIPSYGQWLLGLFSPVALALSIDQLFFLDIYRGGLNMSNITKGQFSVQAGLIMLAIDIVLYGVLGLYFDNVIPTEYGPRQNACFCFMPSYWRGSKRSSHNDSSETETTGDNIEGVPADMKDKKVMSIKDVTKQFYANGKTVNAVNGISLDIYEGQITALLGHNGAGKTTLISMLTGLISPTSGTASIYNLDIRNPNDMSELRSIFGVCPQHDILFDLLSPYEHLTFFAALKGVQRKDIANEVTTVLANCDLSLQRDTPAEKLSGGQKRKLSVAIALIGAPKIVLLDEPTAGMDPVSRRHLWNLLKKSRQNRVIILTTHFMDEADILADRKAIVSKGRVKCVGSSLFLKNRFGLGYHLGLETTNDAVVADVTSVVQSHVPNASPARVHGNEMTFTLPLDNVGQFSGLFKTLENLKASNSKGIAGFGIAMTTLEEVFLQIGEEEVEDEDSRPKQHNNGPMVAIELEPQKIEKNGHPLSAESYENLFKQEYVGDLLSRRFQALMKVRLLLMGRSIKAIFCRLVLPLLFTLAGALVQKYVTVSASSILPTATSLSPTLYAYVTGKSEKQPNFYLGDDLATGANVSNFENKLTSTGIVTQALPSNITYVLDAFPHYVGIDLLKIDLSQPVQVVSYTALYNDSAYISLPVIINTASNAVLNLLAPNSQVINVTSLMWPSLSVSGTALGGALTTALLMGLAIAIIPPFFGVAVVKDREAKARSQLRIAGITSKLYWGTTYLIDFIQFFVVCCLLLVILVAVGGTSTINGAATLCYMLLFIIFVPDLLTFVYLLSFAFSTADNAQTVLTSGFVLSSFLPFLVVSILGASVSTSAASAFHQVLIFLDPPYGVMGLLFCMQNVSVAIPYTKGLNATAEVGDYFAWESNIPITYISGAIHLVLFLFLLYTVEAAQTGHGPVGWYNRSRRGRERRRAQPLEYQQNPEDSDVAAERKRIEQMTISGHTPGEQMPVVCVRGLYKEFEKYVSSGCCGCNCCSPALVKVAVANNSFTVNVGEVFGLLGPNGAGKTTTMNMIIAEETPTDGEVLLLGQDLHQHTESALSSLGYCPQHNPLWDELTLQEHLEIYATIRGVPRENIPAAVNYFLDALKLTEHAKKYSTNLSGGTKRKLCYCISLLGAPRIVLLDEPSTGMDPKSKRFLWDTISATFRSDKRGAILTTHYMEEANALCSRIGIMINGRMECLGSAQHLKNKYGSGYTLEIKLAPATQNTGESRHEKLNAYINSVVPGVQAVEVFGDRITYAVPTDNKTALSEIFNKLEQGKSVVGIEEYSFSQSTLEQVFLSFAKKQLTEEEQAARDRLALNNGQENSGYDDDAL